ncbi:MAG TPA: S24 family peptidase, partial [Streptosporangiaceae bacterium]|nr:S24 family peptidase [Streptosporangiaceae bacterium]
MITRRPCSRAATRRTRQRTTRQNTRQSAGQVKQQAKEVVGSEEGLFILEVVGDSMIGVGIFPGDRVVVCPLFQPPRNGDIVAATIDGVELEGTI